MNKYTVEKVKIFNMLFNIQHTLFNIFHTGRRSVCEINNLSTFFQQGKSYVFSACEKALQTFQLFTALYYYYC